MNTMFFAQALILLLASAQGRVIPGRGPSEAQVPTALVHLKIVAPGSGDDLGPAKVALFRSEGGQDYAKQFQDNIARNIPYGVYYLRAGTEGLWDAGREVVVCQPEVWVVMALQIGMGWDEGGGPIPLTGKLEHLPPTSTSLWVRMVGLYSSFIGDAKVDESGNFSIVGLQDDKCILVVRQGTKVLSMRLVSIPANGRLVIDLAGGS